MVSPQHPYVILAEKAIGHYLKWGEPLPCPENLSDDLQQCAGVFVSLKIDSKLRGCVGSITSTRANLALEIIHNAISSAVKDPRFSPITEDELKDLTFSIDVLTPPEKVDGVSQLNSKVYGVVVKSNDKQGVLLPNLEGVNSPEEQIRICRLKAKIKDNEPVELFRFQVERYH